MNRSTMNISALVFAALVLVMVPAPGACAPSAGDEEPMVRSEFAAPPRDGDEPEMETVPSVDLRLEASVEGFVFADTGMNDEYGSMPLFRAGLTTEFDPHLQVLFALGYGRRSSDLDLGDATFEMTHDLEIELVPVTMGIRTNMTPLRSFRINLGLLAEAVYMKETAPYFRTYPVFESGFSTDSGWGYRVAVSVGPEWRTHDDKWSVGAEAQLSAGGGEIGSSSTRDVSLEGFAGRLFCSLKLGTLRDPVATGEVSQ